MFPFVRFASLVDAYELFASCVRQPHLLPGDLKILIFIPLPAIDRSDHRQINERDTEQFQKIKRQRMRLRTRLMIKA